MLALPSPRLVERIKALQMPVIELGAGNGLWGSILEHSGIEWHGYDPFLYPDTPEHISVYQMDHAEVAKKEAREGDAMLAVWPPTGSLINEWIKCFPWDALIIVCQPGRHEFETGVFDPYIVTWDEELPRGHKGVSNAKIYLHKKFTDYGTDGELGGLDRPLNT